MRTAALLVLISATAFGQASLSGGASMSGGASLTQVTSTAPTFIAYTYVAETSGTAISSITSPAITVTSGDFVYVACRAGSTTNTLTITSSPSNTFNRLTSQGGSTATLQASWATITTSGSTTFTCSLGTAAGFNGMIVLQFRNISTTGLNTAQVGSAPSSSTTSTTPSFTTTARTFNIVCFTGSGGTTWNAGTVGGYVSTLVGVSGASLTGTADAACELNWASYPLTSATGTISLSPASATVNIADAFSY